MDKWAEKIKQLGHVPNYSGVIEHNIQQGTYSDFKPPISPEDQYSFPEEAYGLGDWTPENPEKLGPDGQPLPAGAKGWTAEGIPWYGTNSYVSEWMMGFWNNVFSKANENYRGMTASTGQAALKAIASVFSDKWTGDDVKESWGAAKEYKENWLEDKAEMKAKGERIKWAGGQSVGKTISSFIGQSLKGGLTIAGVSGEVAEQIGPGLEEAIDTVADMSDLPSLELVEGGMDDYVEVNELEEALPNWAKWAAKPMKFAVELVDSLNGIKNSWDFIRAADVLFDPLTKEKGWSTLKDEFAAGRIAYTNWITEGTKEEFVREMHRGENPYLLQESLQNPWAEMAGQMILDPLNFVGAFAAEAAHGSKISKAEKMNLSFLMRASSDEGKMLDRVKNFRNLSKAGDNVDDVIDAVMEGSKLAGNKLDTLASEVTIRSLTTNGKRYFASKVVGDLTNYLAATVEHTFKNVPGAEKIHEVTDILDNIVKLSGSRDEVRAALDYFGGVASKQGLPMEVILSDSSLQTSKILRGFLDEGEDFGKIAKILQKEQDVTKAIERLGKLTDKVAEKIFPTLSKRVKDGEQLNGIGKALLHVENVTSSRAFRGMNEIFANIYMGMSPGYAIRNAITNTLHIFTDEGWDVFGKNPFNIKEQEAFLNDFFLGKPPKQAFKGIGPAGIDRGKKWPGIRAAQWFEERASVRVFAASAKKTMRKMLRPGLAIPDIQPLVDAGWSPATARQLQNLIMVHNGDVSKAVSVLTKQLGAGSLNLFGGMGWVDDVSLKGLTRYDLDDMFKKIVTEHADDIDDSGVIRALDDMFDTLSKYSEKLADEAGSYAADGIHVEAIDALRQAGFDDDIIRNYTNRMQANKNADDAFKVVVERLRNFAKQAGINMNDIAGGENGFIFNDDYWGQVLKKYRQFKYNMEDTLGLYKNGSISADDLFRKLGIADAAPKGITKAQVGDYVWDAYYRLYVRNMFANARELYARRVTAAFDEVLTKATNQGADISAGTLKELFDDLTDKMQTAYRELGNARDFDGSIVLDGTTYRAKFQHITAWDDIRSVASLNGVETASAKGAKTSHLYNLLAEQFPEWVGDKLTDKYVIKDVIEGRISFDDVNKAIKASRADGFNEFNPIVNRIFTASKEAAEVLSSKAEDLVKLGTPANPDEIGSLARGIHNNKEELKWLQRRLKTLVKENWGSYAAAKGEDIENLGAFLGGKGGDADVRKMEAAMREWITEAETRTNHMRWTAGQVATEARNFALLDYSERRNFDSIISLVFPYGFWYTGTYPNWMKRAAQHPGLLANYYRYRRNLEKIHAGQPDWWKYNVNTNELFGLESENPLFFNLEATLNPMNGLTGVDFEDPYKITDTWTQTLNDMNRFGPSTHTLFSILTALNLKRQGQDEAAAKWAGRLIPFTQTLQAGATLLGADPRRMELDPFINVFSGGVDSYTARRVQRTLAQMQLEGMITEEQAIDAARSQSGEWWNVALERAVTQRAPGQLSSFLFGVGFKARNIADLATDQMYQDYFQLLRMREILSPEEFRIQMDKLHEVYPMMNTVLVSDESEYAYNVLGRIPPGASSDFYKAVGINREIVNRFYDSKGDLSVLSEGDRLRFTSAIVDLGALLAIPKNGTKQEWTQAKNEYSILMSQIESAFGSEIQEKIDLYYGLYRQDKQKAREYIDRNPDVEMALDYRAQAIASDPTSILATYYGGIEQINNYYSGQMYDEAERRFGQQIWDIQNAYYATPSSDRKAFLRQYPQLKEYWEYRAETQKQINQAVIGIGQYLREPAGAEFRTDIQGIGVGAQDTLSQFAQPEDPYLFATEDDWYEMLGEDAYSAAIDSAQGKSIPYREQQILEAAAERLGLEDYEVVQYLGIALARP